MSITQEELKKILSYDPETGIFRWIKRNGSIAGHDAISCTKIYRFIMINYKTYRLHRLAWIYMHKEIPNGYEIDHINGNGLDNRLLNLRIVSHIENQKNLRRASNNKSGITGVFWSNSENRWKVQISHNKKTFCCGTFISIFDAVCARKNAEIKYGYHKNHGSDRPL